jgi:hypothetical protein
MEIKGTIICMDNVLEYTCISENHGSKSQDQVRRSARFRSVEKRPPPPLPILESDDSDQGLNS